jgi:MOSC domain-containing protein YiiM
MFEGRLVAIYVHGAKGEDLKRVETATAMTGRGIDGDRYCRKDGSGKPDQEVTLIESEAIAALARETEIKIDGVKARRNLLTSGVPLNHLVGREFQVGEVTLRGIRLCEPCDHLQSLTVNGIKEGLCHRGGLRAEIVTRNVLRSGDRILSKEAS